MRPENLNKENFPGTPAPGAPTKKKAQRVAHQGHPTQRTDRSRYPVPVSKSEMYGSILFGSVACAVTPQRAPTWEPPGPYSSIPDLTPPCSASGTGRGVEEFLRPRLRTGAVAPSCLPFRAEGAVAPMTGSTWENKYKDSFTVGVQSPQQGSQR